MERSLSSATSLLTWAGNERAHAQHIGGLASCLATAVHGPRMEAMPARIIVCVFAKKLITPDQLSRLREQTAETIAAQGRRLVDLVIDTGSPKLDPADHETLMRIAVAMPAVSLSSRCHYRSLRRKPRTSCSHSRKGRFCC